MRALSACKSSGHEQTTSCRAVSPSGHPPPTPPNARVKRVGPERGTVRREAVGSSLLLLHALRIHTERARSALSGDPKHRAARWTATRREASQRIIPAPVAVGCQSELPRRPLTHKVITRVLLSECFDYSMSQAMRAKVSEPPRVTGCAVHWLAWVATGRETPLARAAQNKVNGRLKAQK